MEELLKEHGTFDQQRGGYLINNKVFIKLFNTPPRYAIAYQDGKIKSFSYRESLHNFLNRVS